MIDLLEMAYVTENGLEAEDQSSLNLVKVIGTKLTEDFSIFGDSDEAYRIEGGSSTLIDKGLVPALKDKIEMNLGWALTGDRRPEWANRPELRRARRREVQQRNFDAVILALPFTCLREVEGLDSLGLSDEKLKCIRELGMGQHAKIMVGTTSRVWRKPPPETGLPPSDGSIYSDVLFQDTWETSDGQQPTEAEAGILTVFLGGNAATSQTDEKSALAAFRAGLAKIWPKMAESLDPAAVTSMFWSTTIASPSAATAAPKSGNTPRCLTRRRNQLLAAACNLPASTRAAQSIGLYEWRRAKWKPRCPRARQTHGASTGESRASSTSSTSLPRHGVSGEHVLVVLLR